MNRQADPTVSTNQYLLSAIAGIFMLLPCAACEKRLPSQSSHGPTSTHSTTMMYHTTLYHQPENSGSVRIAEGRVWLDSRLGSEGVLEGKWELSLKQGIAVALARLQGSGTLKGKSNEKGITVDLHPGTIDNNVELLLQPQSGDVIRGTWQLVTDAGVEATGPIELVASPRGKP